MKIYWTHNAINHLVDIYDYISKDSRFYAERMIDRLTSRSQQIEFFPLPLSPQTQVSGFIPQPCFSNSGLSPQPCSSQTQVSGFRPQPSAVITPQPCFYLSLSSVKTYLTEGN
jgi:hypothetical protein